MRVLKSNVMYPSLLTSHDNSIICSKYVCHVSAGWRTPVNSSQIKRDFGKYVKSNDSYVFESINCK